MATIAAFRGIRYNPNKVGDLSKVVSQPYDRIGPDLQDKYYDLHPYNVTRLIKGKEYEDDRPGHDVYSRARDYYRTWLDAGYLLPETRPALYVYRQTFTLPGGQQRTRNAFLTAFQLAEFEEGIVLPHERTLSGPKVDRLNLLRATAVNFELIFMLYPDPQRRIDALFDSAIGGRPADVDVYELFEKDVRQQMWVVTAPDVLAAVAAEMAPKTGLIIADGHHRYETALNYRAEMRQRHPKASPRAAFNYALISMVSMDDPGLVILPTHRLIHDYTAKTPAQILAGAAEYFEVTSLPDWGALEAALSLATAEDRRIGFYDGGYHLLRLKGAGIMDRIVPDRAPEWRQLDVSILHELAIERVMDISKAQVEAKTYLDYFRDLNQALAEVDAGRATCLFILNPTRIVEVKACSDKGEKMPQKSTDFYPKMISGLVMLDVGADERL
ncbi:MAG: DUF1015 domain-containing protein [Anaerolineae bacterium]|nr:DUF1015 domain-containing protein [Anaerolineae bacterium]